MSSKILRLKRLLPKEGKLFIFPMDHGVTMGILPGIDRYSMLLQDISGLGIDAVVLHKGIAMNAIKLPNADMLNYFLHLSASTNLSSMNKKVLVTDVEEAVSLGMDAVSIHVNIGKNDEGEVLKDFGQISRECYKWGMPLMAMMYCDNTKRDLKTASHLVRIAEELGADMVKIASNYDLKTYEEIMKYANIPVVVAGGEYTADKHQLIRNIKNVLDLGVSGIAIGRNIFEAPNSSALVEALSRLLHHGISSDETIRVYETLSNKPNKKIV